ncbi:tryptophan-rich sensory protein [Candidatus Saccharibacteria bacterium]|nr:tryptophan-rich sensory protein [Candidatus Saccharibacteria bacterium]MBR2710314.1 tryptophan-rich sensory protein [Candidatus Saccharibacteria bacterium]
MPYFNFAWTPFFFVLDLSWFAFIWLLIMWALVLVLVIISCKISKPVFWMLLPYLLWCTFAAYLNCNIAILN